MSDHEQWSNCPALRKAWTDYGCTHEFPEDQRIAFVAGWRARAALDEQLDFVFGPEDHKNPVYDIGSIFRIMRDSPSEDSMVYEKLCDLAEIVYRSRRNWTSVLALLKGVEMAHKELRLAADNIQHERNEARKEREEENAAMVQAQEDLTEALDLLLRLFPAPSHLDHDAVVALLRKHGRHGNRY